MTKSLKSIILILIFSIIQIIHSYSNHTKIEIIPEYTSVNPGNTYWLAIQLSIEKDWNTYWINPGEAGTPIQIEWEAPEFVTIGKILWPYPTIIEMEGIVGYGYEDKATLLLPMTVSNTIEGKATIDLKAHINWLECNDICIPCSQDIEISIPLSQGTHTMNSSASKLFTDARNKMPKNLPGWDIKAFKDASMLTFILESKDEVITSKPITQLYYFSANTETLPSGEQIFEKIDNRIVLKVPLNPDYGDILDTANGILYAGDGWDSEGEFKALEINAAISEYADETQNTPNNMPISSEESVYMKILIAIGSAFIGGLILNLMPCVFPVLGIKIMSFVNAAKQDKSVVRKHGIVFSAGVMISFILLGMFLILLRNTGELLGWGFQLQSPGFISFLMIILFLMGLNFAGVFEVGTSLMSAGNKLSQGEGYTGSFLSGVFATLVATPCTAPFMATALAFALSQPPLIALLIFLSLGLGMSLPYLLISFNTKLLSILPKPGKWMETFKVVMAFPLFATVIWLGWVFNLQTNPLAYMQLLFGLLLLTLGIWIYGRYNQFQFNTMTRLVAKITGISCLIATSLIAYYASSSNFTPNNSLPSSNNYTAQNISNASNHDIEWIDFDPNIIAQLQAEGRPVYIDFTAAWCLTCQANKKSVFSSDSVKQQIKDLNIAMIKADWTSKNPLITKAIQDLGQSGVPLNVIYNPYNKNHPVILPPILTPSIVENALKELSFKDEI